MMDAQASSNVFGRKGMLYPMLVVAAASVIIFSAFGVAMMTGLLPRAESKSEYQAPTSAPANSAAPAPAYSSSTSAAPAPVYADSTASRDESCVNCGVVASISPVEVKSRPNGLGMIAGGVAGALLGNQIGRGNGNAVATIA